MKNNNHLKIIIAVVAVLVVAIAAVTVTTKVINSEEPTTQSSELVSPSVNVPTGNNAESAGSNDSWNETETLVQGIEIETTALKMPDELPGEVETLGEARLIDVADLDVDDRPLLVLNAENRISAEYLPHLEEAVAGSGIYLEEAAAEAFMQMYTAAMGQGVQLTPVAGYVSIARQQKQFDTLADEYVSMGYSQAEAEALAARKILPPACSEHNAGLAVDFAGTHEEFKNSAAYKWLVRNAADYGFIERYTSDFESDTGVEANATHWRYVGSAALANDILESGLCFEEWMDYEHPYWDEPEVTTEEPATEAEATETTAAESATEQEEPATEIPTTEQVVIDLDEIATE